MKAGMRVEGLGAVKVQLRNIALRVPDNARKMMNRSAERIVKIAKIMVPEDTGNLMESIRIEKRYGTNNRLAIDVIAGNKMVTLPNGDMIDLNEYALIIHENYSMMNPGKRTLEKQREHPDYIVGEGFLRRAAEAEAPKLRQDIIESTNVIIQGETER